MKSELLVIADQHAAVNTFSGLVHTARRIRRPRDVNFWEKSANIGETLMGNTEGSRFGGRMTEDGRRIADYYG